MIPIPSIREPLLCLFFLEAYLTPPRGGTDRHPQRSLQRKKKNPSPAISPLQIQHSLPQQSQYISLSRNLVIVSFLSRRNRHPQLSLQKPPLHTLSAISPLPIQHPLPTISLSNPRCLPYLPRRKKQRISSGRIHRAAKIGKMSLFFFFLKQKGNVVSNRFPAVDLHPLQSLVIVDLWGHLLLPP